MKVREGRLGERPPMRVASPCASTSCSLRSSTRGDCRGAPRLRGDDIGPVGCDPGVAERLEPRESVVHVLELSPVAFEPGDQFGGQRRSVPELCTAELLEKSGRQLHAHPLGCQQPVDPVADPRVILPDGVPFALELPIVFSLDRWHAQLVPSAPIAGGGVHQLDHQRDGIQAVRLRAAGAPVDGNARGIHDDVVNPLSRERRWTQKSSRPAS
jgi:hypothetical protein